MGFGGEAVGGDRKVRLLQAGDLQSSLTYKWGTAITNEGAKILVAGIHWLTAIPSGFLPYSVQMLLVLYPLFFDIVYRILHVLYFFSILIGDFYSFRFVAKLLFQ